MPHPFVLVDAESLALRAPIDRRWRNEQFLALGHLTQTMRYYAHYHTAGEGHVYQGRFKSFPVQDDGNFHVLCRYVERNAQRAELVERAEDGRWGSLYRWVQPSEPLPRRLSPWTLARSANWIRRVNEALDVKQLDALRWSIRRGSPFDQANWVESIARRLDLESTLRARERQKKKPISTDQRNKEFCPLFFAGSDNSTSGHSLSVRTILRN